MESSSAAGQRVLLLVPARSYRAAGFLRAAARMGLDVVIGSDGALPLGSRPVIPVSPADPGGSAGRILARAGPVSAVIAVDSPMLVLAAIVAERMGLPHNPPDAVANTTDKTRQRQRWAAAGIDQPAFRIVPATAGEGWIREAAQATGFPCVVKAVSLSASQGILRAGGPAAAISAARRVRRILAASQRPATEPLLIEEYVPGPELSIDGLLTGGELTPTVIFGKPATQSGPTFEETLLVTPAVLPGPILAAAVRTAGQAARALGLISGPIHAECRIGDRGGQARPVMLELAARCIGGLCSRALRFPGGESLEELVLANALGCPVPAAGHQPARPSGVFMLPVPHEGVLRAVEGRDQAAAVPGITGLTITIPLGQRVAPLPEGDRYLGFIFAEAATSHDVQRALNAASARLRVIIE
ncbi:MAG TPA: ATP-grasp domain-containing protein [Streptosporangiaceae bacterium]|nr:ATP-grasp domain-containing protein [Streptosporangiaceae bacterium]